MRLAQLVTRTALNPDSGAFIPWMARLSSFIPVNIPICYGLIMSPPTTFNTVLWQWICQTYNAYLNWGNASASSDSSPWTLLRSYVAACAVSISVGMGTRTLLAPRAVGLSPGATLLFNAGTSFLAVSSACFLNVFFMRGSEMKKGIHIFDVNNLKEPVAQSKTAARKAVLQTAVSRIVMALPIFWPALAMLGIDVAGIMPRGYGLGALQGVLICSQLFFAASFGAAAFP